MVKLGVAARMPKLVIGMKSKGFTLIEILVVIVIVGITLGFALLAFGDFGRQRSILAGAEQFANYINFIQQEAIMENTTLGIDVHPPYYNVLRFTQAGWQPMSPQGIFKQQRFPYQAAVSFRNNNRSRPQIVMNASGEITPFILFFDTPSNVTVAKVMGEISGLVAVEKLNAS